LGVPGALKLTEATLITIPGLPEGPLRCLSAGWDFSFLIDSEGGAWASGSNAFGQMADYSSQDRSSFRKILSVPPLESASVGGWHVLAKDEEGETWVWGCNASQRLGLEDEQNRNVPVRLSTKPIHSSAGRFHSLMAASDGLVFLNGRSKLIPTFIRVASRMKSARSAEEKNEK
jgi:alpha-tubulin suppressor-like RCC1 family protein